MFYIKHTGLYVSDLARMEEFYQNALKMRPIQEAVEDCGILYDQLYGRADSSARITKLISEYGAVQRQGDMLELVCTDRTREAGRLPEEAMIDHPGSAHIAFGVEQLETVVSAIKRWGGTQKTDILTIGPRKCCFCQDPEGNWLELIE